MMRAVFFFGMCLAQAVPALAAEAEPTEAAAPAPPVSYRSAFEGYRSYRDEPVGDWRALNAEVGAAGGHVGSMRGAGAGHVGHGTGAAKPAGARAPADSGQAPVRGAPTAPQGGAHGGH